MLILKISFSLFGKKMYFSFLDNNVNQKDNTHHISAKVSFFIADKY